VETGGVIGGGQIGYNFKLSNNFLVGLETDISGLSQSGRGSFANATPDLAGLVGVPVDFANAVVSSEKAVDWLGTVRGRVGWLATPTLLIYGGGGLAYGGVRGNTNIHAYWTPGGFFTPGNFWTGASGSLSTAQVGWTAGGGVEWMFMTNWSFKVEYLYYDLGPATWANSPNSSLASYSYTASATRAGVGFSYSGSVSALAGAPTATNISTSSTRFTGNIVRVGLNFHFH